MNTVRDQGKDYELSPIADRLVELIEEGWREELERRLPETYAAIRRFWDYPYAWYWRARLPERKGQRCRVLARGKMNTICVQFEDGYAVTTSRFAVRRVT